MCITDPMCMYTYVYLYADPRMGNAIKENALHSAVASESDEDDICQIVEALLR